jgi:hypothetical protein
VKNAFLAIATLSLLSCSGESEPVANDALASEELASNEPETPPVSKSDAAECELAKTAAVKARTKYDRDYVSRNPGFQSMSLSVGELTSCKLAKSGAFVGKWGGQRWRYVPKSGSRYTEDPKKVWVGENEGLDDLSWFSEWRSDGASVEKNEELNRLIKSARKIYG